MHPTINRYQWYKSVTVLLVVMASFVTTAAKAQCYPTFNFYQAYPSGPLCSPQTVILHADVPANGYGQFRWYNSETDPNPFRVEDVSWDANSYSEYSFYATDGATIWVSFYDYNTGCESYRTSYTAVIYSQAQVYQDYGTACGYGTAQVQVHSNVSNVTFYLYKHDPATDEYSYVDGNTSGYFNIGNFDPSDQYNYFIQTFQPGGCNVPSYYQLGFDIVSAAPPSFSGSTTTCEGTGAVLTGSGAANTFRWYDAGNNLLYQGNPFTTPTSAAPGFSSYSVRGYFNNGCLTLPTNISVNVNPKPIDGTISASATTIYEGNSVTISSTGGRGVPHYWCSSDGGTTWNIFADSYAGQSSFTVTPPGPGTYRYHIRNQTMCGFCWDVAGGCTSFHYVDVTVIPYPPIVIGAISPAYQIIPYNTNAATLSVNGVSGGDGTYTYQWQSSATPDFANPAIAGSNATLTPTNLTAGLYYRLMVTSHGKSAYSQVARVDVYPQLLPNSIYPGFITVPSGSKPGKLSGGPATGGGCNGNYLYQWQISYDGITFTDITGTNAQGLTYEPDAVTSTTYFRRRVRCGTIGEEAYTNVCIISIGTVDVENLNYIRTRSFVHAGITDPQAATAIVPVAEVKQVTQYFDGMGRLMQTVSMQVGKNEQDMVVPVTYDQYGRQSLNWLPYVSSTNDGHFKPNALGELNDFNKIQYGDESFYYGRVSFEPSPLNRVDKTMAAGNNWVGSNRGVENHYQVNTDADDVKIWTVTNVANDFGSYQTSGDYAAGTLYKNITVDESGHQVIEFRDKEGLVILKKVQLTATPDNGNGTGYTNWLCTYYIYDNLNLLRAVIQPRGVELLIQQGWDITSLNGNILNEQCFRYEYDERRRMISKKFPGAGVVYMIYDVRDRLVFTQDANLRATNQWMTTLYDSRNRPVITGLMTWAGSPAALQQNVTSQTTNGLSYDLTLNAPNTQGTYQAYNSITLDNGFETSTSQDFSAEIVTGNGTTTDVTFVNNPIPNGAVFTVLTKSGYDTYSTIPAESNLTGDLDATYTTGNYLNTAYNSFPYPDPVLQSKQTTGLVTWTQTKVLGTSNQFLYTINIYDDKGGVIQKKSTNQTGGTDITTSQFTFGSQLLITVQKLEKAGSSNPQTHIVVTKNTYNDLGQLTAINKSINSTINGSAVNKPDLEIVTNEYDAMGRLLKKNIGKTKDASGTAYTANAIQTLTYEYNIRNWILGVNRDYLTTEGQTANPSVLFGYELGYDKIINKTGQNFTNSQFNGNITGMVWKSDGDDIRRKYDFTYDAANRLLRGDFTQQNADDHQWNNSKVNYNIKMGDGVDPTQAYDANGNIKRMQQWGLKVTGSTQIDDMLYSYYNNGNKLSGITEQGGAATDNKLGDFTDNNPGNDYGYDANGNMVTDKNKRINGQVADVTNAGAINYNHLNLPQQIVVQDNNNNPKGTITYVYDAMGNKLQKIVNEKNVTVTYNGSQYSGDVTTTTTYLDGFVYESKAYAKAELASLQYTDKPQFLSHEEGRARYLEATTQKPAHYEYDYFIKDHLGNVRMVLTEEQKQDIYPAATLEGSLSNTTDAVYTENQFYNIDPNKIADKSEATGITDYINKNGGPNPLDPPVNNNSNSNVTANSQKLYRLDASGGVGVTGLGMTLKVMSGDKIDIYGKSYYFQNNTSGSNYNVPVIDLLTGLLGSPTGVTASKAVTAQTLNSTTDIYNGVSGFLTNPGRGSVGTTPKAYINWILLDDNFKYVTGSFERVSQPNTVESHTLSNIPITKNGYLYVYVSNESPVRVYFDNLQVIHSHGSLLEETHYYPFGLTMAGISSKAMMSTLENRFKFNDGSELESKEFSDGSGLDLYATEFRSYDPQIGRFVQMDPLGEFYEESSPYVFANNNPILLNDPLGLGNDTTTLPAVVVRPRPEQRKICYTCKLPAPDPASTAGAFPLSTTPYPQLRVIPGTGPKPRIPFPIVVTPAVALTLVGVLIPVGGPSFPLDDETLYYRYPELYETIRPHPEPNPNLGPDDPSRPPLYLVRFGSEPESAEKLGQDAMNAASNGFPHGVSSVLRLRISGTDKDHRSALLKEVLKYFAVKKTGKKLDHYTVILPNPVTQEVANLFNSLFTQKR